MNKKILVLGAVLLSLLSAGSAYAWTVSSGSSYVKSNEKFQLYYVGEAYSTRPRSNMVYIEYYRSNSFLGGAYAYDGRYQSVSVMDSLNPWAAKTQCYYRI